MEPQGISVTEIRLGLPNTCYYLEWKPAAPIRDAADRRALLKAVRARGRSLDWTIYAAGRQGTAARLVFRTSADNLDSGLAVLLGSARDYRLYMVEPAAALPLVACHVHEAKNAPRATARTAGADTSTTLPDIHFGLFMGERSWAERMLDLLTRCAQDAAADPYRNKSLSELAETHANPREAIADAYRSGHFSLKDIAEHFGMHFSEVSAIINTASP